MTVGVYIVGAGPGDPELLTLKAARLLNVADVVLHDALVGTEVLALARRARLVNVGKRAHRPSTAQRFINRMLVTAARHHACVVRLKGGDPGLFGRLDEEMTALRSAGLAFEIVPGVTAACAAAAALQASLTQRGVARGVRFVTLRQAPGTSRQAHGSSDTLAIYMAGHQVAETAQRLMDGGHSGATPLVLIEAVSTARERRWVGTLGTAATLALAQAREGGDGPVLLLLGKALAQVAGDTIGARDPGRAVA
ncbi:MAG: uroporphyrinogen-III C-methyltransferase [Burkholderiales bacterium]|nr:uroporphyrinogen-III C-methyltransferase [Burkholderiales bacterium]